MINRTKYLLKSPYSFCLIHDKCTKKKLITILETYLPFFNASPNAIHNLDYIVVTSKLDMTIGMTYLYVTPCWSLTFFAHSKPQARCLFLILKFNLQGTINLGIWCRLLFQVNGKRFAFLSVFQEGTLCDFLPIYCSEWFIVFMILIRFSLFSA